MQRLNKTTTILFWFLLIGAVLVVVFPVAWVTLTAFRSAAESFSPAPPYTFTLDNLRAILLSEDYPVYISNSLIVAGVSTLVSLVIGAVTGYTLARFRSVGTRTIFGALFIFRAIPPIATLIPLYLIVHAMGLYDTLVGILIPFIAAHICFASWIMRGFFEEIPAELEEAAMIDGCSQWGAFLRVSLPNSLPGLTAAGCLMFLADWNQFLFPVILTGRRATRLLTVGIAQSVQEHGVEWHLMTASAVVAMVPAFLIIVAVQRYLVRGLTLGGVKE